jgi:N-acetylmuramoyl-L-alanine amidase
MPHVTGPLEIKVIYPKPDQLIQSKDSNFIFGSVGNGDAALTINGVLTPVWPNGSFMGWLANPPAAVSRYDLVAATANDTARQSLPIKLLPPPSVAPTTTAPPDTAQRLTAPQYATLVRPATVPNDTDAVVRAYEKGAEDPKWLLLPGTVVKVAEFTGSDAQVDLGSAGMVRIPRSAINLMPPTYLPVGVAAKAFRVTPASEWVDIAIPVNARPQFLVEEGQSSITLTLYSTSGAAQSSAALPATSYVTAVASTPAGPDVRYTISTRSPVFGYQPLWQDSVFTFRVRRPPSINATDPLRGLTIAIDPGHPPLGATGPTALYEGDAVLAVGLRAQALLQARGVNVIMTRTKDTAVAVDDRPMIARRANAQALVSIHLNALPDGKNPFVENGTTTYYFHPHALPLATTIHQALLTQLGLPDKGVKQGSLVLTRPTWMPAVLCEGAFIMMPDQEAAIRTPEYQERYARGIVEGLESYFRSLGQAPH